MSTVSILSLIILVQAAFGFTFGFYSDKDCKFSVTSYVYREQGCFISYTGMSGQYTGCTENSTTTSYSFATYSSQACTGNSTSTIQSFPSGCNPQAGGYLSFSCKTPTFIPGNFATGFFASTTCDKLPFLTLFTPFGGILFF